MLVIGIVIVAVAVIVPLALVVVPNETDEGSNDRVPQELLACQRTVPCANGGTNVISTNGACRCICVNGFTGDRCITPSDAGCTTADLEGSSVSNVTVGSAIPRLIEGAQRNFSIPLNATTLLSLFSAQSLSCSAENALVTFNGLSARSIDEMIVIEEQLVSLRRASMPMMKPSILRRQQTSSSTTDRDAPPPATTNGIIYATGSPGPIPSLQPTVTSVPEVVVATGLPAPANPTEIRRRPVDFARVSVLYILQDTAKWDTAADAQERFQQYFSGSASTTQGNTDSNTAQNYTLAGGFSVNIEELLLVNPEGVAVGGQGTT